MSDQGPVDVHVLQHGSRRLPSERALVFNVAILRRDSELAAVERLVDTVQVERWRSAEYLNVGGRHRRAVKARHQGLDSGVRGPVPRVELPVAAHDRGPRGGHGPPAGGQGGAPEYVGGVLHGRVSRVARA